MSRTLNVTYDEDHEPDERYGPMMFVNPGKVLLPTRYKNFGNEIYNFGYRNGDIMVSAYPKSGTTWTASIVWAMTHINELPRAYTEYVNNRTFILDNDYLHDLEVEIDKKQLREKDPNAKMSDGITLQLAKLEKGPRIIWTHLPFNLQNPDAFKNAKVVYVMRHPKDNLFSRFNHFCKHYDMTVEKDLPPLAEEFMKGDTLFGNYWNNIQEAWKWRNNPNLHMMYYEDMKADTIGELKKLDKFLETGLDDEQLEKVKEHVSFDHMKKYPTMSPLIVGFEGSFLHKGQVGASKGKLPPELDAKFDAWTKENGLKIDENFKYL